MLALYPILKDLVYGDLDHGKPKPPKIVLPYSLIWNTVVGGAIKGTLVSSQQYETDEYQSLYLSTLSKQISDNFSADLDHSSGGSIVTFYPPKFDTYESVYNHKDEYGEDVKIQVEVLEEESDTDPEGYEGYEGYTGCVTFSSDIDNDNDDRDKVESEEEKITPTHLQYPSDPSDPSDPSPPRPQATCPDCGEQETQKHLCDPDRTQWPVNKKD